MTAASHGIKGVVDAFADLPDAQNLPLGTIFVVRQDTGAPDGKGQTRIKELEAEEHTLARDLQRHNDELRKLVSESTSTDAVTDRMADLQDRIRQQEQRATEVREELITRGRELLDEREAAKALALFDPVWDSLAPREKIRIARLLVKRVDYDGRDGTVSVIFHPSGIKTLADELEEADE